MKVSPHRRKVNEALETRHTDLASFVTAARHQGKTIEEVWMDLRGLTGVPFSVRTFYRWVDSLEQKVS